MTSRPSASAPAIAAAASRRRDELVAGATATGGGATGVTGCRSAIKAASALRLAATSAVPRRPIAPIS